MGVKLGLALPEGLGISVGVAGGKGVCIGKGVDVGKGVVLGGAVGVEVGVETGVGVKAGVRIGVGVGSGLTNRSQPDRNSTRRRTAILKFPILANIFADVFPVDFQRTFRLHRFHIGKLVCKAFGPAPASRSFRVWSAAWIPSMIRRP